MSAGLLRVLHLYPKADYFTGAAIQLRDLARGLAARGHHVTVSTRPSQIWANQCALARVPYVPLPMRSAVDLRSVLELMRILRRERIEVVHCHKGRARTLVLLAGLFVEIPVLILNRGVSFPLGPFNRLGYVTPRVTAVVAVSHSIKQRLMAAGVPEKKIEVIYSGTDTERFHPGVDGNAIRAKLGVSRDQFLITQVGVRSWRGNDDVLDAMAEVVAQAPDARLLFVGAPAPRIPVLLDQARARRLDGCVHVWGHREDIAEILAAADLTVDAAYAGAGLTGSLRESLAVETPVVGTMLEGIPELVREGETGLLVPPRSPEALARAILWVKAHPVEAKGMARAGRKRVEADFSTEVKVQRTEALYRHLLAARS